MPVGVPKTGFMIESMVTATARNIGALLRGEEPKAEATGNAVCLADFGDSGVAFVAEPQIRRATSTGRPRDVGAPPAKVAYEKYFLRKMRRGESEPFCRSSSWTGIRRIHERPSGLRRTLPTPNSLPFGDEHAAKRERAMTR